MLEEVATYLIVAPLAASLVVGALAAFWFSGTRPAPTRVVARDLHRHSRDGRR